MAMTVGQKTKIKIKKFRPYSVASESTEELRKQKSNRKGWILFSKRFQSAAFMCEKKSFQISTYSTYILSWMETKPLTGWSNWLSSCTLTWNNFFSHMKAALWNLLHCNIHYFLLLFCFIGSSVHSCATKWGSDFWIFIVIIFKCHVHHRGAVLLDL